MARVSSLPAAVPLEHLEKANASLLENHQGEPDHEPEARTTNRSHVAFAAKTSSNSFSSTTPPPRTVSNQDFTGFRNARFAPYAPAQKRPLAGVPVHATPSPAPADWARLGEACACISPLEGHDADPTTDTIATIT
jgi:hypothetical protein